MSPWIACTLLLAQAAHGAIARPPGAVFEARPSVAPTDTPWVAPEPPRPSARYGSYRAASASLQGIVRRVLGAWADSARWSSGREDFWYNDQVRLVRTTKGTFYWDGAETRDSAARVPCLHMRYESHSAEAPGTETIERALQAAGWDLDNRYSADGPDGTYFALACREALVEVRGSWDGGDDSDTTYVPRPGETVELRCVPRPPEPHPRGRIER
jgi:hypothetical protein